ncbi:hypothetical protein QR680_016426 [Steinernema hermaphroditum]|uniref:Uncharacterized protein n=1 Tax=Steinernema hermaphroditum TaxID=289476 RepID=A0AA39LMM6_9BILA|nr:hypothetical protein QR680_016426 [Steinernema hermaphroditum]
MDLFLFHHDRYRYFYNCSKYTAEEWTSFGQKHNAAGCVSIFLASISFVLYVPCIKVMHEPEIWQFSCYKLMFLNGIVDLLGVAGGCLTGILSLKGVVFCSYPTFLYVAGTFTVSQYGTQQVISVLLALNRCLEFWNVPALTGLFEGKRIYAWFMIPAIYFVCMVFFTVSCPFSSIVNMWMFDPYFGIPGIIDDKTFVGIGKVQFERIGETKSLKRQSSSRKESKPPPAPSASIQHQTKSYIFSTWSPYGSAALMSYRSSS